MPVSESRIFCLVLWLVSLPILTLSCGCRTSGKSLFVASGPGWQIQEGQALWRPGRGYPEIGGDVVLASHEDGRCLIQFSKTPMSLVVVQTTRTNWLIRFPPARKSLSGRRQPPARFAWLHLHAAISGEKLAPPLLFEREPEGGWRLENTRTGETVKGFLGP